MMRADGIENFDTRYREFYPRIYRYIFRLTGSHPEAEQLVQETFVGLYRLYSSPQGVRNLKALAYRIAHNACLNYLLREKRLREIIGGGGVYSTETTLSPEEKLIKKQNSDHVREALTNLPPRDQKCLLLHLEEFSYAEISEATGIKKSSVGKILARAAERLARDIRNGDKK